MGLWGFIRKQVIVVVLTTAGAVWTMIGFASQAYQIWTAGLQPWAVQATGAFTFMLGVFVALYRFHEQGEVLRRGVESQPMTSLHEHEHLHIAAPSPPNEAAVATKPEPEPEPEREKERELHQPAGTPDTRLVQAWQYVHKSSSWADRHKATGPEALQEMVDKLYLREVSAWGRREPSGRLERIPWNQWAGLRLNPGTANAETDAGDPVWYGVQFEMSHFYRVWPYKRV